VLEAFLSGTVSLHARKPCGPPGSKQSLHVSPGPRWNPEGLPYRMMSRSALAGVRMWQGAAALHSV